MMILLSQVHMFEKDDGNSMLKLSARDSACYCESLVLMMAMSYWYDELSYFAQAGHSGSAMLERGEEHYSPLPDDSPSPCWEIVRIDCMGSRPLMEQL